MKEFKAQEAANGGWLVTSTGGQGFMADVLGAFSTSADMIAWLAGELNVPIAIGVKETTVDLDIDEAGIRARYDGDIADFVIANPHWIPNEGRPPKGVKCDRLGIMFRSGEDRIVESAKAHIMGWLVNGERDDIIAWRPIAQGSTK